MEITPEQVRAARALLRLDQSGLAKRAQVSIVTIRRLETADANERVAAATVKLIRQVLEQAGAEFISSGVRRRHVADADANALYEDLRAISVLSAAWLKERERLTEADLYDEDGLPA